MAVSHYPAASWIEQQPVPKLGDESTPIEEVQAFYNFWYSATSWREFGYDDEVRGVLAMALQPWAMRVVATS